MPFKIRYKFTEDEKFYTCYVTHEQYNNFKELSIIQECNIVKKSPQNYKDYNKEMQKAIDLATKNNTTHIRKLSEIVR